MVITAFSSTELSVFRLKGPYWFFFNSIIVLSGERCNGYERSGNYSFFPEPNRMYLPIKVDENIYCNALRISQKYGYEMRLQDLELLQSLSYKLDLIF